MDSYGWEYKALLKRAEMCEVGQFHNDWDNYEDGKDKFHIDYDDEDTRDPFRHLIPSGIVVPPPETNTRGIRVVGSRIRVLFL